MISGFKVARFVFAAAFFAGGFTACVTPEVERVCPSLPQVKFTPDPEQVYGVKDNVSVTITPFDIDAGNMFTCPATVCFSVDGSEPQKGRASTYCYPAPVRQIAIKKSTHFKYYVVGVNGSQSAVHDIYYKIEPPPVSTCSPKSKASREPINVELTSNKEGTIFYTKDGSDPDPEGDTSGATLSGPAKISFKADKSMTVKFRAQDAAGNLEEKTNSCDYKVDGQPPTTTVDPTGTSAASAFIATISSDEAATIYYTTDGSKPEPSRTEPAGSTKSEFFEANVNIAESTYLRFYAIDGVGNEEEEIHEEVYFIGGKPAVKVDPGPGSFAETSIVVTMAAKAAVAADQGNVEIWYTTDKSTPVRNGGNSIRYTAPITDFSTAGEHTLKYIAFSTGAAGDKLSDVKTAVYDLGQVAQPFFRQVNFTDTTQYDDVASSKSVEMIARKGFARLRHKIPVQQGSGIGITSTGVFASQSLPQQIHIERIGATDVLHYVSGTDLRMYNINSPAAPSEITPMREVAPANRFANPCAENQFNGLFLGLNWYLAADLTYHLITPWTSTAFNCGGFASFTLSYPSDTTRPYIKANLTQFSNDPQSDPFIADFQEINDANDPVFPNLPKTDSEVVTMGGDSLLLQPLYRNGNYYVDAFYAANGAPAITSPVNLDGRALAIETDALAGITAVGDASGQLYTLSTNTLTEIDRKPMPCDASITCRINELTLYRDLSNRRFVIMALGYYGATATGQVAIAELTGTGTITLLNAAALPSSDDYQFNGSVEAIRILGNGTAVAAVREQGLVLLNLTNVGSGTVASRGYINGRDLSDSSFWALDVEPFPSTISSSKFAVIDGGRTNTALNAGVQFFDALNVDKYETTGVFYTTNLNNSGKAINRVSLDSALPDPLPNGVTIQIVADGVVIANPINIGIELAFTDPLPTDVRAKITFASPDTGATELKVDYLKFKFSPVE